MNAESDPRRPISRRLMAALFVLMIVPISGWYFLGELTSREVWDDVPVGVEASLQSVQTEIRFKLALTLGASVVVLGLIVFYLKRELIDPLDRLARGARRAESEGWRAAEESLRSDEIGDLARALDRSIPAMERRAEEAHNFAVNLSHELRTPLAAIRGAAEILTESDPDNQDRELFLGTILTESKRLERLVVGLLDLERETSRLEKPVESVDPLAVADRVVALTQPLLERKNLDIEIDRGPDVPTIGIEGDVLERILFGLLENAIKFSPAGGEISVRLSVEGSEVLIEVADQGPGVPDEYREVIFDRHFTRGRGGAAGSGLGLAIVDSLVTSVGGRVWVGDSATGARFCCALPTA